MSSVREPIKVTSIDKKNRIINAGLEAFSIEGYYNTTTAKIAKRANVSTGIVYSYFKDKKDILIYAVKRYFETLYLPIENKLKNTNQPFDLRLLVNDIINISSEKHEEEKALHEEMVAMSHLDDDVHHIFMEGENKITDEIINFLENNNIVFNNMKEKVHMAYNLIENYCHEEIFHN